MKNPVNLYVPFHHQLFYNLNHVAASDMQGTNLQENDCVPLGWGILMRSANSTYKIHYKPSLSPHMDRHTRAKILGGHWIKLRKVPFVLKSAPTLRSLSHSPVYILLLWRIEINAFDCLMVIVNIIIFIVHVSRCYLKKIKNCRTIIPRLILQKIEI